MKFFSGVLGVALTAIVYMVFPLICIFINGGRFSDKKAHRISLWNSIVLGAIFCIITIEAYGAETAWNTAPAVLYYWINKTILTDKSATTPKGKNNNTFYPKPKTQLSSPPQISCSNEPAKKYGDFSVPLNDLAFQPTDEFLAISFCRRCGIQLINGSLYCHKCGTTIIVDNIPSGHSLNHRVNKKKKYVKNGILIAVLVALVLGLSTYLMLHDNDKEIYNAGVLTISSSNEYIVEMVYELWQLGGATEEKMFALVNEYGGQLKIIYPDESTEGIYEWCFSSARKLGDCKMFEDSKEYTLCYLLGYNFNEENVPKRLIVAVEPDFYPFSWEEDGRFYGIHINIAKEIAKRNGLWAEFVSASHEDLFVGISDGTYNLVLGVELNEQRKEVFSDTAVDFTDSYYDDMVAMFNVKEFDLSFSEWSNFKFTIKEMIDDGTMDRILYDYKQELE